MNPLAKRRLQKQTAFTAYSEAEARRQVAISVSIAKRIERRTVQAEVLDALKTITGSN